MATVPLSGSNVRFLRNVPFNNDYKHSRWFTSKNSQLNYFMTKPLVHSIPQANFQRIEGRHFVAVNKNIDELWGTNYLMFQNSAYSDKWFYAFVTQLEYKNRGTTHVHFEIDVLHTWKFDMNFKPSYVVREHRPLWNSDGTPVLNTIDEGLYYGTEYDNKLTTKLFSEIAGGYRFLVIVSKTPIEYEADNKVEAKIIASPQPLSYYIIPFKNNGDTPNVKFGSGSTDYPISSPSNTLSKIYDDDRAVNNIVSIYVTEYFGVKVDVTKRSGLNDLMTFNMGHAEMDSVTIADGQIYCIKVEEIRQFVTTNIEISDDKYASFSDVTESKLLMHPYTSLVFDDFRGNRTEYKLEHIKGKELIVQVKGGLGLSNNVSYGIVNYNNDNISYQIERAEENALISNAPSDLPIVNDMLAAFLQGNRNSIQNQRNSIMWNGVFDAIGSSIGATASANAQTPNPYGVASSGTSMIKGGGNTVLQLKAIQAKQDDISNIPPQLVKQGSDVAYDYGNNLYGLFILRKQIKPEYRRILGDFFNMYGYMTNRVKIPNFRTRQRWNYVQTESCVITGNFNNEDLQELKNVFDNGITLWHTDDIGNYDLSNGVR